MSSAKNVVESVRDVVQDLLVPELKAVKVSLDSINIQMDSLRTEMKLRDEKMEQLVRSGDLRLEELIRSSDLRLEELVRHGDERNEAATRSLSQKLDDSVEVRERLASLEARTPRQ